MYPWTTWLDEVVTDPTSYKVNGSAATIVPNFGTVQQEGTPQDDDHFNNIEIGVTDAHLALQLLVAFARANAWDIETGSVALTNSQSFPFNNSIRTISLASRKESTSYIVLTDVAASDGNVGEIEVSDKLTNGFKLAYTGSASSATIKYVIIGGYMK